MSRHRPKAYRHLASVLANAFDDGSDSAIERRLAQLPDPGNTWSYQPPPEFPMPWATHWGQDEFGLWCGITMGDSVQRLRWIPPGEFHMGSAEGEPERGDDEQPHRVIITWGYWLAETACSQDLWRVVMGDNPSRFRGDDLPVEQVSWEDVQAFCQRLNERLPGLQARLPTEAEWEYACRAGTETPFWWGSELTPELANYDGNYPYNQGSKDEYRDETLPIKSFSPNPWGLYQMHGNVYEWCADWYADYQEEEVRIDPMGPERGTYRVGRGGSWGCRAWRLRAASRFNQTPGYRNHGLGFRLAAGPRPGGAEESGVDGESAAEGSVRQVIAPTTAPALF